MVTLLVTGASGLVGSRVAQLLKVNHSVLTPSHWELDITKKNSVTEYFDRHKPHVVIHAAAFIDPDEAERERGDKNGLCWQVNVVGTKNIVDAAKKYGAYIIFISTGSVFRGTEKNPGPFRENYKVTPRNRISWYGWSKSQAEKHVDGAIVRIAHPVKKEGKRVRQDYIYSILSQYRQGKSLFTDQFIQMTFIDDLIPVFEKLINARARGTLHVTSPDWVSPYDLSAYILRKSKLRRRVTKGSLKRLIKASDSPLRFHEYCTLDVEESQKRLGMRFKGWREVVDAVLPIFLRDL